jgi:hypothetical protein
MVFWGVVLLFILGSNLGRAGLYKDRIGVFAGGGTPSAGPEKSRRAHHFGTLRPMALFFAFFPEMMISRGRLP